MTTPASPVLPPFFASSGPENAKIAIVGEAWGKVEEFRQRPLVGQSGEEFNRMLSDAGLVRNEVFCTNTFALRPSETNDIYALCGPRGAVGAEYSLPPLKIGSYVLPKFLPELDRLKQELESVGPNVIVALGNTALWALTQTIGIGKARGTVTKSTLLPGVKVLPTIHPAAVLRNWSDRPLVVADLIKAKREGQFPEIRRPSRNILILPTLPELHHYIITQLVPAALLSIDIETSNGQITCIGFAPSPTSAVVIPFTTHGKSYWTHEEECEVFRLVGTILALPIPKLFQNGLYDLQYIFRYGWRVNLANSHDTMLYHHALYPEMKKSLGFLGSLYCNEVNWKEYRTAQEEFKADE